MHHGLRILVIGGVLTACGPGLAASQCKLGVFGTLPITMHGLQPTVLASINGNDAQLLVDSGAFFSMVTPASALRFKLRLKGLPYGMQVRGIGGQAVAFVGTANHFALEGYNGKRMRDVDFVVGGGAMGDLDGIVGQNILAIADIEYDLGNGLVRLVRPEGCGNQSLAYWPSEAEPAMLEIARTTANDPQLVARVQLNGATIKAVLDTGAMNSVLSRKTAERLGFKTDGPGVTAGGYLQGIDAQALESWIAPFPLLDLGGEQIRNARLRVADLDLPMNADLLLGADFFLSHRLFVARSQGKVWFTFNGGRVFDLSVTARPGEAPASATSGVQATTAASGNDPTDAEGFLRRGLASGARNNLAAALADLDEAVRRDPRSAEYRYQRYLVHERLKQVDQATTDLDEAIRLAPGRIELLKARGFRRWRAGDETGGGADLDAVMATEARPGDLLLEVAAFHADRGAHDVALQLVDRWLAAHDKDDAGYADTLNSRCWERAMLGQSLQQALDDCERALSLSRSESARAAAYDSRALVRLRMGQPDKAIPDYRTSLRLVATNPWALFGLSLAEGRTGNRKDADAHRAEAIRLDADIAGRFMKIGLGE